MEIVMRVAVIYFFVYLGLRVIGKREFGELSPLELVTLLLIPEIVAQAIPGGDDFSLLNGLTGVATLLLLVFITSVVHYLKPALARATEGVPSVLVHDGELVGASLDRERVSPDEVMAAVREAGLDDLSRVRWAILEVDGRISVVTTDARGGSAAEQ